MDRQEIVACLEELNTELALMGVVGELCLYGGAVMCVPRQRIKPAAQFFVEEIFEA